MFKKRADWKEKKKGMTWAVDFFQENMFPWKKGGMGIRGIALFQSKVPHTRTPLVVRRWTSVAGQFFFFFFFFSLFVTLMDSILDPISFYFTSALC
jgi:hypothetical protein